MIVKVSEEDDIGYKEKREVNESKKMMNTMTLSVQVIGFPRLVTDVTCFIVTILTSILIVTGDLNMRTVISVDSD